MTKADICEAVVRRAIIPRKEAAEMVEAVLDIIKGRLEGGEPAKIAGFGIFSVQYKTERRGRNPQTGDMIQLASRRVVSFKLSPTLKKKINDTCPCR